MMKKFYIFLIISLFTINYSFADEGMWLPFLAYQNIDTMQKSGFQLSADEIYNNKQRSLSHTIVLLGKKGSATTISPEGLLLTSYSNIYKYLEQFNKQKNNYIKDGFWAKKRKEERHCLGLSVKFLISAKDVTQEILSNINTGMAPTEREKAIQKAIELIEKKAVKDTHYSANIKSFFFDTKYYLFVTEVFRDIRLVAAPRSSIARFGGDSEKGRWSRHNADFALLRVYSNKKNKPNGFSKLNIPFRPKCYVPISAKGYKENDFSLTIGYPKTSSFYLPSYGLKLLAKEITPQKLNIREEKLNILRNEIKKNKDIKQKYLWKYILTDNYKQRWLGEQNGIRKLHLIEKKESVEKEMKEWINSSNNKKQKYRNLFNDYEKIYSKITPSRLALELYYEALFSVDISYVLSKFQMLTKFQSLNLPPLEKEFIIERAAGQIRRETMKFMKNYSTKVDKKLLAKMLEIYVSKAPKEFIPDIYKIIKKKYKNNYKKYVNAVFKKSMFTNNRNHLYSFLIKFNTNKKSLERLRNDPLFQLFQSFYFMKKEKIQPEFDKNFDQFTELNRVFFRAFRNMKPDTLFCPDANGSMRYSFGKICSGFPKDGVEYQYICTSQGIFDKHRTLRHEDSTYKCPKKLRTLLKKKNFGIYGINGEMPICFLSSNHTGDGNSGSPVFNSKGEIIGICLDRYWEASVSDIAYNEKVSRSINLDVRYVLFLIEHYAKADNLLKELTIYKKN